MLVCAGAWALKAVRKMQSHQVLLRSMSEEGLEKAQERVCDMSNDYCLLAIVRRGILLYHNPQELTYMQLFFVAVIIWRFGMRWFRYYKRGFPTRQHCQVLVAHSCCCLREFTN
jgi:hypothetical protein